MLEEENTMQEDEKLVFENDMKKYEEAGVLKIVEIPETPVPIHDLIGDVENIKADLLKLITVVDGLEQRIVNVDAKYKMKINECCKKSDTVSIRDVNKQIATEMKAATDKISAASVGIRDKEQK